MLCTQPRDNGFHLALKKKKLLKDVVCFQPIFLFLFFFCHFSVTHYFCQLASIAEGVEIKNRHHFTSVLSLSQPLSSHAHGRGMAGWRRVN